MSDNYNDNFKMVNAFACDALTSKKAYENCVITLRNDESGQRYNAWQFTCPDFFVLFEDGKIRYDYVTYDMTLETLQLVSQEIKKNKKREKRKENKEILKDLGGDVLKFARFSGVIIGVVVGGTVTVGGVVYGLDALINKKRYKIEKQVQEYKKTLPNWNDSILYAPDDAALRRAMDRRVQAEMQVEHFRDSLLNRSK